MQKLLVPVVIVALVVRCAVSQSCSLDPDRKAKNYTNVLILGAGISGIAAARTLEVNGMTDFLVIEATDRIGGRIREHDGTNIEVGANWIQGLDKNDKKRHPIWREWLECDQDRDQDGPKGSFTPDCFTRVYDESGSEYNIKVYENIKKEFDIALDKADDLGKTIKISRDKSLEEALKMKESGWDPQTPLDKLVEWEGVDFCSAIRPRNISVFHHSRITYDEDFLADDRETVKKSPGCDDKRDSVNYLMADEKGYSHVVRCLARNFKDDHNIIRLNSNITKIQTANDCVCVTVKKNDLYCGNYAIVTFSIGALQASINNNTSSVKFVPRLPLWKEYALMNITPVHYGKIHLQFKRQFWNDNGEDDQQILGYASTKRGYYPYFIMDKNHPNITTVDVTEDLAVKVAKKSIKPNEKQTVINEVMDVLRKIFGEEIPELHEAIISNWSIDPFFRCTFSVIRPNVSEEIFKYLLEPVNGTLYFAGEALNGSNSGFTQGGYGSGVCVAKLLLGEKPVVGLERTNYTVSEDDSEVEVCVVIKSECNVPFPFNITVSTRKGPVSDPTYFQEISDSPKTLKFEAHVKKDCININIDDVYLYADEVLITSISLQSISGQYSGIRLLTNEARVDVTDGAEDILLTIIIFSIAILIGFIIFIIMALCFICLFIYCVRKHHYG